MTSPQAGKPAKLRKVARHEQILLELKFKPHVRIAELARRFGVSTETVRRDVEDLHRSGLLDRAHGGASATHGSFMPSVDERAKARIEERERIGRYAASQVKPGEVVMIDAGTTTLQLARFLALAETPIKVITNGLQIAMSLGQSRKAEITLCPGTYLPSEAAVAGTETVGFLDRFNADRCFIGASGLSEREITERVTGFAEVKSLMMKRSRKTFLLIDSQKFGEVHMATVAPLSALSDIVIESVPDSLLQRVLERNSVTVHAV